MPSAIVPPSKVVAKLVTVVGGTGSEHWATALQLGSSGPQVVAPPVPELALLAELALAAPPVAPVLAVVSPPAPPEPVMAAPPELVAAALVELAPLPDELPQAAARMHTSEPR